MATKTAQPNPPLTPAMFHVLLALAGDGLHGYAILKEVELRTDGEVKAQHRHALRNHQALLNDGLIIERPRAPRRPRRRAPPIYRLTPQGREVAAAEAARLEKVVALAAPPPPKKGATGLRSFADNRRQS